MNEKRLRIINELMKICKAEVIDTFQMDEYQDHLSIKIYFDEGE